MSCDKGKMIKIYKTENEKRIGKCIMGTGKTESCETQGSTCNISNLYKQVLIFFMNTTFSI